MERIRKLLQSETGIRWLFHGDSITHGAVHTYGHRDYTELFAERVRTELRRRRDLVIKAAFDGDTTSQLLNDFDERVAALHPHVVLLMIGMNDCATTRQISRETFRANLKTLCDRMVATGALPVLQTTCPILPGQSPVREPNFDSYMDAIREIATQEKLPLIDHVRHWREATAKAPARHQYWMCDALHPNEYGHRVFAEHLFQELGIFDAQSSTCRLFKP